jgi:hypothetical protein
MAAGGPLWAFYAANSALRLGALRIEAGSSRASALIMTFAGKAGATAFKSAATCDLRKETFVPSFWNGRRPERRKLRIVRVVTESIFAAASVSTKSLDIVAYASVNVALGGCDRRGRSEPEPRIDIALQEPAPADEEARGKALPHFAADRILADAGCVADFLH